MKNKAPPGFAAFTAKDKRLFGMTLPARAKYRTEERITKVNAETREQYRRTVRNREFAKALPECTTFTAGNKRLFVLSACDLRALIHANATANMVEVDRIIGELAETLK